MRQLSNKCILLGISGGIAAYKSAELVRLFKKRGANVRVVMTSGAQEFITPLTLQALSGNLVHTSLLDTEAEAGMGHIELARWADVIVIAPATADVISRIAYGQANDLLTTLCLASKAPLVIAPAMNQAMWSNESTQNNIKNIQVIKGSTLYIFGPDSGEQACGDIGLGRMLDPVEICAQTISIFKTGSLSGKNVTITAGPTREAIDPVRYISNHSSGKMGYALAEAARDAGANVTLITGPVSLPYPDKINTVSIISAKDMYQACIAPENGCDIFIAAAAVADYRSDHIELKKIKKTQNDMTIDLVKNIDILASIAQNDDAPFCVGFAAETNNVEEYAQGKLISKKLNMIIANDVSDTRIGFNSDNNAVVVLCNDTERYSFDILSKTQLAKQLIALISIKESQSQV
jgi:phosphopantothenoylcysteine decarboxylase/phosphopantothenate--cysteine ligase